jgi:dipeptidyl aminopeptidase/acylaminoacyl peptidase
LKLLSPEQADHLVTGSLKDNNWDPIYDPAATPMSPDANYIVYTTAPLGNGGGTSIRTTTGKLVATFEMVETTDLYARGYRDPEEFVVKAADGVTPLWGVLYKPAQLDPKSRYPVIDAQYASFLVAAAPRNLQEAVQGPTAPPRAAALTECGMAVVAVDARGTAHRSRAFSQAGYQHLDTMNLEDHIAAIRQLAQRFPWLDADRVGILGGSYGGWSSLRGMLRFPEFFKAGVATVPVTDWQASYPDYEWQQFVATRDGIPADWAGLTSSSLAGNLKGKLMLVIAGLDENVLPGSEMQFAESLMKADKDFDLMFLPQDTHFTGWGLYTGRRIVKFLQTNLGAAR